MLEQHLPRARRAVVLLKCVKSRGVRQRQRDLSIDDEDSAQSVAYDCRATHHWLAVQIPQHQRNRKMREKKTKKIENSP